MKMNKLSLGRTKIKYKIIKKPIKHIYLQVKEDFVEIRCNSFVSKAFIEKFIIKHSEYIIHKLSNNKYFYLFGEKYEKNEIDEKEIYKEKLPSVVLSFVEEYSNRMNLYPNKISFRFNKTRWGSCSFKNNISFNYYLAKLPKELIEYIVVHELAHIKHKNHSAAFWREVGKYLPDVKNRRKLLREYERKGKA